MKVRYKAVESIAQCRVGKVPQGARKFLKREAGKAMRRAVRLDVDNTRPRLVHRGWYW